MLPFLILQLDVSELQRMYLLRYYCLISIVYLYYDHILTLPAEINCIWGRKFNLVTVLFLLNRYTTFFGYIPILFFLFNTPATERGGALCYHFGRLPSILNSFNQIIIAVLLVMRCYLIYERNVFVFLCTFLLALATVSGSIYSAAIASPNHSTTFNACTITTPSVADELSWLLPSVSFDIAVFVLTFIKTYQLHKAQKAARMRSKLTSLLMRDGGMYFAVMAGTNIYSFLLIFSVGNNLGLSLSTQIMGNNSVLAHTLSVTMISHLVLNLRATGDRNAMDQTVSRYTSWIARDMVFAMPPPTSNHFGVPEEENAGDHTDIGRTSYSDGDAVAQWYLEEEYSGMDVMISP